MSETKLDTALVAACRDLESFGISSALVGGLAVSLRARIRFTRDVDLAVSVASDAAVEALVRNLQTLGYKVKAIVEQDERARIATVRLLAPVGVVVDLLAASSGIEAEIVARAESYDWEASHPIRLARREELLALKVLAMTESRPQDKSDARALLEAGVDVDEVRQNLENIEARGFHRKQNLQEKLQQLLATVGANDRNA